VKVERIDENTYRFSFSDEEILYLDNESKENQITMIEMLEMVLGVLFIGGYLRMIGRE